MNRIARNLLMSGLTAAALVAGPARADDEAWERRPPPPLYVPAPPAPAPVYVPAAPWARPVRWGSGDGERWREYRELDVARDRFYARHHRRGERARFESWYSRRRMELAGRWGDHDRDRW